MGLLAFLKKILLTSSNEPDSSLSKSDRRKYPIYDGDFIHSITWRCVTCNQEIYWMKKDSEFTCHNCNSRYSLREDEFPELPRAKCWNCGEISDSLGGFRLENIRFDCPHCEFEWKSSRY